MSNITNDGLTQSGTGCTRSQSHMTTVGVKWLTGQVLDVKILHKL